MTSAIPVDPESWWGYRAALEEAISSGVLESVLDEPGDEQADEAEEGSEQHVAEVISLFARRRRVSGSPQQGATREVTRRALAAAANTRSCSWLHSQATPDMGCVPVLLLDEQNDRGLVAQLRVRREQIGTEEEV